MKKRLVKGKKYGNVYKKEIKNKKVIAAIKGMYEETANSVISKNISDSFNTTEQ